MTTTQYDCGSCGAIIDRAVVNVGEPFHEPDADCRTVAPFLVTPHYPTSAELAAFRCTFDADEAMPGIVAADYMAGPRYPTTRIGGKRVSVTPGGAWPQEREHGIGWTDADLRELHSWASLARSEANRLRREQWRRDDRISGDWRNLTDAEQVFAPGATLLVPVGGYTVKPTDRDIRAFAPQRETPGDYYKRHRLDGVSD